MAEFALNLRRFVWFVLLIVVSIASEADTQTSGLEVNDLVIPSDSILESLHVSEEDYITYLETMNTQAKYWYQDLSPLEVLLMTTDNANERRRFARQLARQEKARVEKELAAELAYQEAWRELYGDMPVLRDPNSLQQPEPTYLSSTRSLSSLGIPPSKYIYIVRDKECLTACTAIMNKLRDKRTRVDLVFSFDDDADIRRWAQQQNLTSLFALSRMSDEVASLSRNSRSDIFQLVAGKLEVAHDF